MRESIYDHSQRNRVHSSRIYNFGVDKTSRIVYNIHCSRGRGGIGIRARLRGVWATVRVQVPSTAPTKDADIDTMSASFILPEKSLFTGLFGLFHFLRRFKVQAYLRNFHFRMVIFVCTLKRKRLGVQKRVHSETEHFRVRNGMKKAEAHLASTLISFPFLNSNVMLPSRFTVPFSSSSDHT